MSVPGQVTEYKLRFRGYSLMAVIFLNQTLERLNGQEGRSRSRKQVFQFLLGKVTRKQTLPCQPQSSLTSEPGGRQLRRMSNIATTYLTGSSGEHIRCGANPSWMMLGVSLHPYPVENAVLSYPR